MAVAPEAMTGEPKSIEPRSIKSGSIDTGLERQRRIRRTMWWLTALALSFYIGFIVMSVRAARG